MKKFFILALATLFVAGMIAETAMAEDRLELTGEVRVRAWDTSGKDVTVGTDPGGDITLDVEDSDQTYWDQRFRVGANINVADGVKGVLRFDFADDSWGSDNWSGVRYGEGSELQIDRAYMDITKGMVNIKAGQQLIGLGNYIAYDNNTTGLALTLKPGPVSVTLAYTKEDERGSLEDEEDDGTEDLDSYAIQVGFAQDNFGIKGFYAALKDGNDDGIEPNVFGLAANATVGMLTINAELDVFGGEVADIDVMGTQFWGNVEAAVMDNLKVGVDLIYSDGNDTDDEIKITGLNDWGDWVIDDRGPFNTEICPLGTAGAMDPDPFGIIGDVFDELGVDTAGIVGGQGGALGGGVYAVFTAMEGLDLSAQIMFLTADEDSEDGGLYDDVMVLNLGADWMFAPNAHLWLQYSKTDWSTEIDELDDSYDVMVAQISINF